MGDETVPPTATPTSTSSSTSASASISTQAGDDTSSPPDERAATCQSGTTHCVGPSQRYATLAGGAAAVAVDAAVDAAGDGAVIKLLPGSYRETVAVGSDDVTIRSRPGGRATVDCGGLRPAGGKACILAVGTNLTVENLRVTGARGPDANEACFRNEPGTRFVVRGVECFGSNNGILGSGASSAAPARSRPSAVMP
ncbi:MAG: hypothetical protein OEW83_06255 [Acidimicrobiia bacterium]|nr:hypothetical protein [Acidimicrobiia bacterium]